MIKPVESGCAKGAIGEMTCILDAIRNRNAAYCASADSDRGISAERPHGWRRRFCPEARASSRNQ